VPHLACKSVVSIHKFATTHDAATKTSAELISSLQKAYPDAGLGVALDIGAKVNKGDMKW